MDNLESRIRRTTRFYLRKVNRAVAQYGLLAPGDRVAVAVSGGKDSLALLRLLRDRRAYYPPHYDLVALHVVYTGWEVGAPPPEVLANHFAQEQVPYEFVTVAFDGEDVDCFRCAWQRRKALFQAAQRLQCNKLALAHHLEDMAETTLLNLFQHGRLERPAPLMPLFGGALTLVRPLVFFTAHELRRFALLCGLPVYESTCPHRASSQRAQVRRYLREVHRTRREVYINIYRAAERCLPTPVPRRADRGRTRPQVELTVEGGYDHEREASTEQAG